MSYKQQVLLPTVLLEELDLPMELTKLDPVTTPPRSPMEYHIDCSQDGDTSYNLRLRRGLNTTPDSSLSSRTGISRSRSSSECSLNEIVKSAKQLRHSDNVYYREEDDDGQQINPFPLVADVSHSGFKLNNVVGHLLKNSIHLFPMIASASFVVLLIGALVWSYRSSDSRHVASSAALKAMTDRLSTEFPSQTKRLWAQLRVALEPFSHEMLADTPDLQTLTAVILLVNRLNRSTASRQINTQTDEDGNAFACFQIRLRILLGSIFRRPSLCRVIQIPGLDMVTPDTTQIKTDLDEQLHRLYHDGSRCFQFPPLEQFPAEAVTYFHGNTDSRNTLYKGSILLFTLRTPFEFNASEISTDASAHRQFERDVRHRLRNLWISSLGSEETDALLSRLTRSIAVFHTSSRMNAEFPADRCRERTT